MPLFFIVGIVKIILKNEVIRCIVCLALAGEDDSE